MSGLKIPVFAFLVVGIGFLSLGAIMDDGATNGASVLDDDTPRSFNHTEVEVFFIEFLNQERHKLGVQNVSQRDVLTEMGENHSQNMAKEGYFNHTEPDGDTIRDRYHQRGLLPQCHLPTGKGGYYAGAENIAKTYTFEDVEHEWATGGTYRITNEEELAWSLFQMWMHSPPHRKAMTVPSADQAGLGIHITGFRTVYASLELC